MSLHNLLRSIFFWFLMIHVLDLYGQEVPKISHYTKETYQAENQNWAFAQADDCRLYIANSIGMLEFDGKKWRTYILPNRQIVRSIGIAPDGKIYTGGYASIGYWEADRRGQLIFHSLIHLLTPNDIKDEEIWNIVIWQGKVIFQSFSKIFILEDGKMQLLLPPSNIMFLTNIDNQIFVPTLEKGLFRLSKDNTLNFVKGSELLINKRIATILPNAKNSIIIGTQRGEFYRYQSGEFSLVKNELSRTLSKYQLNKGCQLKNGNYIFGTILKGLFETDQQLGILRNINQELGLQNNTILSLFEKRDGDLWVGMDKGLDLIEFGGDLSFFNDVNGLLGTVYSALQSKEYFYIGTNQGIFYKRIGKSKDVSIPDSEFQILDNSQGQVWQLKNIDGQLFCGHNSGTFIIEGNKIRLESPNNGGWSIASFSNSEDWLIQGSYAGLVAYEKIKNSWKYSHKIDGFGMPIKKIITDENDIIWGIGPHKSLYSFRLSEELKTIETYKEWTKEDGIPSLFNLDISIFQNKLVIKSGDQFFNFDASTQKFIPVSQNGNLKLTQGNYKIFDFGQAGFFKVFPDHIIHQKGNSRRALNLSLVPDYENIIQLDSANFLFCLENGYAILNRAFEIENNQYEKEQVQTMISEVRIADSYSIFPSNTNEFEPPSLKPKENQIKIYGTVPCAFENRDMEYKLVGVEEEWTDFNFPFSKEYRYLPTGDYKFILRDKRSKSSDVFSFTILPKWIETIYFKALLWVLAIIIVFLLYKLHLRRLDLERKKMEMEKAKLLKQQLISLKNEQLEKEVIQKSEELANSTINLIKKNEVLLKIKDNLKQLKSNSDRGLQQKGIQKLQSTINNYLTNEEDWKLFESNFNQVHETFLRKLKQEFPALTPGDLKLAAYLKMNLQSKDIAPLLNISVRSVENKRHRLRLKLRIETKTNLTEFLMRY